LASPAQVRASIATNGGTVERSAGGLTAAARRRAE
jgi:hypothetical protein